MERWQGRVALVTGASSGIGAAIAEALVHHGMKVVGCARSVEKIQVLAEKLTAEKGKLYPIKCDLRKEDEIAALFKCIKDQHGGVDVCVNSAGSGYNAPLLTGTNEQWRDMFEVNILALSICTREAYASMKERNVTDGHIIHVNSMLGHTDSSRPGFNFYTATKHCLTSLMQGLRNEIRATGTDIRVSAVSPAATKTELHKSYGGEEFAREYFATKPHLLPSNVANAVIYALGSPKEVEVFDVLIYPTRYGSPAK